MTKITFWKKREKDRESESERERARESRGKETEKQRKDRRAKQEETGNKKRAMVLTCSKLLPTVFTVSTGGVHGQLSVEKAPRVKIV